MWSDNETSEDLLGFKVHAELLIDVINDEKILPVTIGVFGDWGSGKSSVLKIINDCLSGKNDELKDDTLVLYFNGWVFEGYDDAKAALLESIIEKFAKHRTLGAKVKKSAAKLLKSVNWMRVLGLGFKKVVIPGAAAYFTGGLSLVPHLMHEFSQLDKKVLADKLSAGNIESFLKEVVEKKGDDTNTLVREFRDDFKEMIEESKIKKLVVIIDDLDRCTPERIIENLEAIKLFLNVDKTAFFIGADPRIVRHAIEFRYRREQRRDEDSNERIVDDYLEKLIQIPYILPKLSEPEVETYLSMLICKKELSKESFEKVLGAFQVHKAKDRYSAFGISNLPTVIDPQEIEKVKTSIIAIPALVPLIAQSLYGNPRQIKRFLNTYTLRKRLANVADLRDFNDALLAKLMILEYTEINLFKKLFEWQAVQSGVSQEISDIEAICKDKTFEEVKSDSETKGLKEWHKQKVFRWLNTEPKLHDVDLRDYFWISRDKISTSIEGSSLIPPVIRTLVRKLAEEVPAAVSLEIIKEEVSILNETERICFLDSISQLLKKEPKKKRHYEIFHQLLDSNISDAADYYKNSLKVINTSEMEPAIAVSLRSYKDHSDIGEFVINLFKSNNSPAARAFNIKKS